MTACRDAPVQLSAPTDATFAKDKSPPTKPTNLQVTGTTAFSVSLKWNPSTDNSGNFSYRVRHSWGYEVTLPKTQTSYTWTGNLESRNTYSFWVYAVDAAGNKSPNSNTVTVTLPRDTQAPTAPVLSVTGVGPTHVSLAWSSTDDGPFIFYSISRDGAPTGAGLTSAKSATYYLLQPGTTYTFTAIARDNGPNWSPVSAPLTVTTLPVNTSDTLPPTTPTNVRADLTGDGSRELHVRWTKSTDNVDPQAIIRYDVHVNGVLEDIVIGGAFSIVYGVAGNNVITVVAIDTAGNRSAPGTFTMNIPF